MRENQVLVPHLLLEIEYDYNTNNKVYVCIPLCVWQRNSLYDYQVVECLEDLFATMCITRKLDICRRMKTFLL